MDFRERILDSIVKMGYKVNKELFPGFSTLPGATQLWLVKWLLTNFLRSFSYVLLHENVTSSSYQFIAILLEYEFKSSRGNRIKSNCFFQNGFSFPWNPGRYSKFIPCLIDYVSELWMFHVIPLASLNFSKNAFMSVNSNKNAFNGKKKHKRKNGSYISESIAVITGIRLLHFE